MEWSLKNHERIETRNDDFADGAERLLGSAIETNLHLTYENRIEAHENARQLLNDLRIAGEDLRAKPESTT